jgi:hypothetical protein
LPTGCKLELPIYEAQLPRHAQFIATESGLGELAIAVSEAAGRARVIARGLFRKGAPIGKDLPWEELRAPPRVAETGRGWLGIFVEHSGGSSRTARIWHEDGGTAPLVTGDQLTIADVQCRGERCAVLTSLARTNLAPGASLFLGRASEPSSRWSRLDVEAPADQAFQPSSVVSLSADGTRGTVALQTPTSVALWEFSDGRVALRGEHAAPFGTYDVLAAPEPLVIGPGARVDVPCTQDAFPLKVAPFGKPAATIDGQAAPQSLMARPLARGALLVWLAPVSCRNKARKIVYALVVTATGEARGAPMAVADASGFAVAARGDRVSLWLRTERGLSWLRARCAD